MYNHFLRVRTESWERTQKTLRRPKLAPGADPNAKHPEYVKDSNGKTVWEECVNESYDPEAKAMGRIPSKELTMLKNACLDEDGNLWLKQADSSALGYSTMNLDAAFDNFFRGIKQGQKIGHPRFKRRFDSAQSYKTQGGQLLGTYPDGSPAKLILKGMGKTPVPSPLPEGHPLRTVRWQYVYLPKVGKVRVKEKIANIRKDATHKLTRELVDSYDVIASRNMGSSDMMQHKTEATKNLPKKVQRAINRKTADGNFFEFNRQLAYKSAWANRAFVEVPNDTPTAQVCSRCGHEELVLAKDLRPKWTCPECGTQHDRKANGAQNVLEAGLDILHDRERAYVTKAKKTRKKKRSESEKKEFE